ncbi:MAG: GNAT family N-acetyltransferase [Anaerolineae bacterium]
MIAYRPVNLENDLPALARLLSITEREPVTVEQASQWWEPTEGGLRLTTLATAGEGDIVGMADVERRVWERPGLFRLDFVVDPGWRGQGIGRRLFSDALSVAQARGALEIETSVRDNDPASMAFAERRGYKVARHTFESSLDLTTFDETPFVAALDCASAQGIRFFSLADMPEVTEAEERKLYEINRAAALDNPGNEGAFPPFEQFCKYVFQAAWYRADGQLLAADGDRWVGLAAVAFYPDQDYAYNAFTGVARDYRGRGLAQALKLLAIRRAITDGAHYIRTDNDSRNGPMLAVNRKLGYQPQPGTYTLIRTVATDNPH